MPYIHPHWRQELDQQIAGLCLNIREMTRREGETSYLGILNYTLTSIIIKTIPKKKYWLIAGVTGVLTNMISELYRKYAADYEDEKICENGDLPWNG